MTQLRRRSIVFACIGLLHVPISGLARAAEAPATIQGAPGAAAAGAPLQTSPAVVVSCDKPSSPRVTDHGPISVSVNPATAWQPRGGEVLIAVKGEPTRFVGLSFLACFAWNRIQAKDYFSAAGLGSATWEEGFVMVRPSDQTGLMNLGVVVPPLDWAPTGLLDRWFSPVRSAGLGLVPVADMRLIAYTKEAVLFDEVRPVGITNVFVALLVTTATLALALAILHRLAAGPRLAAMSPPGTSRARVIVETLKAAVSGTWILTLVQAPDGRASLSALQILLWTLVVAASAVYVMTLSGNLINITPGTLTLLGIAGAAGLIAAFAKTSTTSTGQDGTPGAAKAMVATPTAMPSPVAPVIHTDGAAPQWRDLVLDPKSKAPDITRIQMLLFTVVSAAFVIMQVLNYFVVPDIPVGYQILIGLSNGVYVGNKFSAE
jgi:hypothetical protein